MCTVVVAFVDGGFNLSFCLFLATTIVQYMVEETLYQIHFACRISAVNTRPRGEETIS